MYRVYVSDTRSGYIDILYADSEDHAVKKLIDDWEIFRNTLVCNKESIKIHKVHQPMTIFEIADTDYEESLLEDPVAKEVIEAYEDERATQQPL